MNDDITKLVPALRRFAYSLTGSVYDADDLLQNTIERLLSRNVPPDIELIKWAFKVCRNLWIDEYRSRKVRKQAASDPDVQGDSYVDGEEMIYQQITLQEVNDAMSTLPDDQRSVLALVAVQGFAYKDVAEVLKIPIGTVMSRLARARVTLSQRFGPQTKELGV